jgi:hypothetical protein
MMLDHYSSEDCIANLVGVEARRVSKSIWANRLRMRWVLRLDIHLRVSRERGCFVPSRLSVSSYAPFE